MKGEVSCVCGTTIFACIHKGMYILYVYCMHNQGIVAYIFVYLCVYGPFLSQPIFQHMCTMYLGALEFSQALTSSSSLP